MLKRKKKQLPSTEKGSNSDTASTIKQSPTECSSLKLFRSIDDLPLSRFIDLVVDDNLFALVISGTPTERDLLTAFDQVQREYAEVMKDGEFDLLNKTMREINRLNLLYEQILELVGVLRRYYNEKLARLLTKYLGYNLNLNPKLTEDYDKALDRAINRSKSILIDIKLKSSQLEAMQEKQQTETTKPTRRHFQGVLIALSNHVGFSITDNITVFEYCNRVHQLNKYLDQLNRERNGRG